MSPARRRRVVAATALVLSAAVAASGNGTTYAAFSDFGKVAGNEVGATRVAVGLPGGDGPSLAFTNLKPGVAGSDTLAVPYRGSIPGDVAFELSPRGGSPFCEQASDGSWTAKDGGALQISFGTGWFDYCALLDEGVSVPIRGDVAPGSDLDVSVAVQLVSGTDHRYSELADVDTLSVTARQTGVGAFTDWTAGTISISTGLIAPVIPAACGKVGSYQGILTGTDGDDVIDAGEHKQIVLGLGGNDVIDGGNAKDCLVGGDGDDVLEGGNGKDVMIGGDGFDTCNGGHAPDVYECEAPLELTSPSILAVPDEEPLVDQGPPPGEDTATVPDEVPDEEPVEVVPDEPALVVPTPEIEDPTEDDGSS